MNKRRCASPHKKASLSGCVQVGTSLLAGNEEWPLCAANPLLIGIYKHVLTSGEIVSPNFIVRDSEDMFLCPFVSFAEFDDF